MFVAIFMVDCHIDVVLLVLYIVIEYAKKSLIEMREKGGFRDKLYTLNARFFLKIREKVNTLVEFWTCLR